MGQSIAIVVGSSGGIGSKVASGLVDSSIKVIGIDLSSSSSGDEAHYKCDASVLHEVEDVYQDILGRYGVPDYIVSCPGIYYRYDIAMHTLESMQGTIQNNFFATTNIVKVVLSEKSKGGPNKPMRIVLVGSLAGFFGGLDPYYAASKAAVHAFAKSIAREWGSRNVVCNIVSPGPTETNMSNVMGEDRKKYYESTIPIGRLIEASEVANVCKYLLVDAPGSLNGISIEIDGGLLRR